MTVTYHLPDKYGGGGDVIRADKQLYNDLINYIEQGGLAKAYQLDSNLQKYCQVYCGISIPIMTHCITEGLFFLLHFGNFVTIMTTRRKKEKKPHLTQEGLNQHVQLLPRAAHARARGYVIGRVRLYIYLYIYIYISLSP